MIQWDEDTALQEIETAGCKIRGRAITCPDRMTATQLTALDYLINQERYYTVRQTDG